MRTDLKRIHILFFIIAICAFVGDYVYATEPDTLAQRLEYQTWIYPQEKVYVATDKNIYVAGDTIRFRAFLVDALKLTQQKDGSKYVYVEVVDPFGQKIRKIKVLNKDGVFAGIVPLPDKLAEGTYTLGAYTLFMKNQGNDFIFRKPLPILSRMAKKYRLKASLDGNILSTSLSEQFSDKPVRALSLDLSSRDETLRENIRHRSDYKFSLNPKAMNEEVLKVRYDSYEKFIRIPKDTSAFSVTFHPEGGYLIPGVRNKIAFKAIGSDGLSKDISGQIVNGKGDNVSKFKSAYKGMGVFELTPEKNEEYAAIINGKSFQLPPPNANASIISVNTVDKDSIEIGIKGRFEPGLSLLADNCGIITLALPLKTADIVLNRDLLGSGLTELYLIDSDDNIVSSRMIFNRKGYMFNDSVNSFPPGDYAVTSRKFASDTLNTVSIVSELMLQSDLKGHIENPDYYFIDPDSIKDRHLDNLLLTQGWKRYDIPNAIKGKFIEPKEPMEIGGELTGTVYSRWKGKPLQGAIVNVLAPEIEFAGVAETDSLGRYAINGMDWQDGTYFAVQAFNKNGNREHNHVVDEDVFMQVDNLVENFTYEVYDPQIFDNGAVWLQELEVTAPRSDEELYQDMLKALGVRTVTAEDIVENNYTTYEEIVRKIPGLNIINGNLVNMGARGALSGRGGMVEFWVDGVRWIPSSTFSKVSQGSDGGDGGAMPTPNTTYGSSCYNTFQEFSQCYPIHMMESIQYYRPSSAMVISMSAALNAGALVLKTKDGSSMTSWDHDLFIKRVTPKGYQNEAEAYEPHFIYDPVDDNPTPISYWYPKVSGVDGINLVENSDTIIEGITDEGLPYFGVIKAKKENQ